MAMPAMWMLGPKCTFPTGWDGCVGVKLAFTAWVEVIPTFL